MKETDQRKVIQLGMTGQFPAALEVVEAALEQDQADIEALLLRIKTLRMAGRWRAAIAAIEPAKRAILESRNPRARAELAFEHGFIHRELGRPEQALPFFHEAVEFGEPRIDYFGAICSTLCDLDRNEEAVEWRHRILRLRDADAQCAPEEVITAGRPNPFDPARPGRNIVSYCLFGSDPYYHECAVTSARVTPVMFPEFTARFYCAPDVPVNVLQALEASGAQIMMPRAQGSGGSSPMEGTFWRFLTFDDPNVDVVLCRDVDSPILPRERAAIDLWLAGNAPFYCLRDHAVHAELILAGMWGGFTGVLPRLGPLANAYMKVDHTRFSDQRFLRSMIWPRLRHGAIMQIDSIASLEGSVDFPAGYPNHGRLHVGVSWTRAQILGAS